MRRFGSAQPLSRQEEWLLREGRELQPSEYKTDALLTALMSNTWFYNNSTCRNLRFCGNGANCTMQFYLSLYYTNEFNIRIFNV